MTPVTIQLTVKNLEIFCLHYLKSEVIGNQTKYHMYYSTDVQDHYPSATVAHTSFGVELLFEVVLLHGKT